VRLSGEWGTPRTRARLRARILLPSLLLVLNPTHRGRGQGWRGPGVVDRGAGGEAYMRGLARRWGMGFKVPRGG
jgi:hypothetical protein